MLAPNEPLGSDRGAMDSSVQAGEAGQCGGRGKQGMHDKCAVPQLTV